MRRFYKKNETNKKAFSLIELSVVLIIIAVFISGILSYGKGLSDVTKVKVTKDRMEEIYKAMGNYAAIYGRLPCPAPITQKKSDADYGIDKADGLGECKDGASAISGIYTSTDLIYGMVPVKNLKLSNDMAEDGFGSKIAYVIDRRFTGFNENGSSTDNFNNAPSVDVITVNEVSNTTTTKDLTNNAAFVLVSYGGNKNGAFDADSETPNATSSDAQEQENDLDVTTNAFDDTFVFYSDESDVFDDILFYKTKRNIMIDFDLMSLVTCKSGSINNDDVFIDNNVTPATWPEAKYEQIVMAENDCDRSDPEYNGTIVTPTKKCGAFGQWKIGAIDSCQ